MTKPDMLHIAAREASVAPLVEALDAPAATFRTLCPLRDVFARAALADALRLFIETPEGSDEFDAVDSAQ